MTALMYHDVVSATNVDGSGFPGRDAALYKIGPEQFDAHLYAIGRSTRNRRDLHDERNLPSRDLPDPPDLVLTFDDGGIGALRAAEVLERHSFIGHFFVTTNYIGTRGFLAEADLRELARRGHVIGSHSCSHPLRMAHCSQPQLLEEW